MSDEQEKGTDNYMSQNVCIITLKYINEYMNVIRIFVILIINFVTVIPATLQRVCARLKSTVYFMDPKVVLPLNVIAVHFHHSFCQIIAP